MENESLGTKYHTHPLWSSKRVCSLSQIFTVVWCVLCQQLLLAYLHCTSFFAILLKFYKIVTKYEHFARDVDFG